MATRWFAVSRTFAWTTGETSRRPTSMVHAKEMGTTRTACGLVAHNWHRLWEVPFEASGADRCEDCVRVATGATR